MSFSLKSWSSGSMTDAYAYFGCRLDSSGAVFRVWAPGAREACVTGSFCGWEDRRYPMEEISPGLFSCTVQGVAQYDTYKFVWTTPDGRRIFKSDPFAFHGETPPANASKAYALGDYPWNDVKWMARRKAQGPVNLYQLHAGSFRTYAGGEPLNYRKLGEELIPYLKKLGCTHAAFLSLLEHMDGDSAGEKTTGFFALTSRYGVPDDFRQAVDQLHQAEIGVIMDWNPAGFPVDDFGLSDFAGQPYWEAPGQEGDFRFFDFERPEVRSFLLSSACFLLDTFHLDGLRIPRAGEIAERPGGAAFLRKLNQTLRRKFPTVLTIGAGNGLGFSLRPDPEAAWSIFGMAAGTPGNLPAFREGSLLELDAGEVRQCSIIGRMPGSYDEKFARFRAGAACFRLMPGSKLSMMGNEFAQFSPWRPGQELDWVLLDYEMHRKCLTLLRNLNDFCRKNPAVRWEAKKSYEALPLPDGLCGYVRTDEAGNRIFVLSNFTGQAANRLTIGVDRRGKYAELFNTNEAQYGGEGRAAGVNFAKLKPADGKPYCIELDLPPFTTVYLYKAAGAKAPKRV